MAQYNRGVGGRGIVVVQRVIEPRAKPQGTRRSRPRMPEARKVRPGVEIGNHRVIACIQDAPSKVGRVWSCAKLCCGAFVLVREQRLLGEQTERACKVCASKGALAGRPTRYLETDGVRLVECGVLDFDDAQAFARGAMSATATPAKYRIILERIEP